MCTLCVAINKKKKKKKKKVRTLKSYLQKYSMVLSILSRQKSLVFSWRCLKSAQVNLVVTLLLGYSSDFILPFFMPNLVSMDVQEF